MLTPANCKLAGVYTTIKSTKITFIPVVNIAELHCFRHEYQHLWWARLHHQGILYRCFTQDGKIAWLLKQIKTLFSLRNSLSISAKTLVCFEHVYRYSINSSYIKVHRCIVPALEPPRSFNDMLSF